MAVSLLELVIVLGMLGILGAMFHGVQYHTSLMFVFGGLGLLLALVVGAVIVGGVVFWSYQRQEVQVAQAEVEQAKVQKHAAIQSHDQAAEKKTSTPAGNERPAWLDAPLGLANDGSFQRVVSVGPYSTREECDRELANALQAAADAYVDSYLIPGASNAITWTVAQRDALVRGRYYEPRQLTVGPMVTLHAWVVFDASTQARLTRQWHDQQVQERVRYAGMVFGAVLTFLAVVYLYLRLDQSSWRVVQGAASGSTTS